MLSAEEVIAQLGLKPLPGEGGYFARTWSSPAGSAIYFLITPESHSALHRLQVDELWHFYGGDSVEHVKLDPRDGSVRVDRLGSKLEAGEVPQLCAPAQVWQGARLAKPAPHGWALLGCTLAPPWEQAGSELASPTHPQPASRDWIPWLTALKRQI